ncbi:MAG: hypothetical protein CMJ78_19560 [Planctomycetaceae bacterium]|nr:hypothetical protein [Planctomycetaceae bacterium]
MPPSLQAQVGRVGEDGIKIYGEELPERCDIELIVKPPPTCRKEVRTVPSYSGKICYIVFPGSTWEQNSPAGVIRDAQTFFEKYCIYLNFEEKQLSKRQQKRYKKWYLRWKERLRRSIVPRRHLKGLKKRLKAQNPNLSQNDLNQLLDKTVEDIVKRASIPKRLHSSFYRKMRSLHKKVARKCKRTLVVFIDEYICYNPKPTRASATQLRFNQIGITAPDRRSHNILAHELVHLLGKPKTYRGGTTSWEHQKCPNSVMRVTRDKWYVPYNFANDLTIQNYAEMIRNRAGVKLIQKVK